MTVASAMHYGRSASGLMLLPLILFLTACAGSPSAPLVIQPVKCEHPTISPYDHAGLVQGISLYYRAVETCNALNGHENSPDAALEEAPEVSEEQPGVVDRVVGWVKAATQK